MWLVVWDKAKPLTLSLNAEEVGLFHAMEARSQLRPTGKIETAESNRLQTQFPSLEAQTASPLTIFAAID
jgi:hypothetical protein